MLRSLQQMTMKIGSRISPVVNELNSVGRSKGRDQVCFHSAAGMSSSVTQDSSDGTNSNDNDYEAAVTQLFSLQSNAESIIKARKQRERHRYLVVPNMVKFLQRSGLNMEEVDNLSVIHVSGTKGKGSTCAFCERITCLHGYKTGLFTSPHLVEVRERIRINGRPIGKEMFSYYFWKVYNKLKETETSFPPEEGGGMPAYFAFLTVLSVNVFVSEGVDVAIMEVGIGGQFDSTNFFKSPVVCGMTSLGLDHTALLGTTIEQIAWNKSGIFKKGRPAVCVQHKPEAMQVVLDRAKEIHSPIVVSTPLTGTTLARYKIKLGIAGDKQVENASLAVQLFQMWEQERGRADKPCSSPVDPQTIATPDLIPRLTTPELDDVTVQALNSTVWPGRAQTLNRPGITYYLDGAHTQESIEVCRQWFTVEADNERKSTRGATARVLVFNITGDREPDALLSCLQDCDFDAAVFCTNQVSLRESFNKADQKNKTVSTRFMVEKTDKNKVCWDKLMAAKVKAAACNGDSPDTTKNCNNNDISSSETNINGNPPSKKQKLSNKVEETTTSDKKVSNTFPSIVQGLAWATHGRDSHVTSFSPDDPDLPPLPDWLTQAEHVQVLVTGSLLLVGGVLTVIHPNMND